MKVSELITQLSAYNPDADVFTWACDVSGDIMDDVANVVEINRVIEWSNQLTPELKRSAKEVFIHVTVQV